MKKSEQIIINNEVLKAYDAVTNEYLCRLGQLRSCNASVYSSENYFVLRSYGTFVACIDRRTNIMYDFLRYVYGYTSTSAQHIGKFHHDYTPYPWNNKIFRYYPV